MPAGSTEHDLAAAVEAVTGLKASHEVRFAPPRRWRFDLAWPAELVAAEVEGGVWSRGRHVRGKGFEADCRKYNHAAALGWLLLRFTTGMVQSGEAARVVCQVLGDHKAWYDSYRKEGDAMSEVRTIPVERIEEDEVFRAAGGASPWAQMYPLLDDLEPNKGVRWSVDVTGWNQADLVKDSAALLAACRAYVRRTRHGLRAHVKALQPGQAGRADPRDNNPSAYLVLRAAIVPVGPPRAPRKKKASPAPSSPSAPSELTPQSPAV